MIIKPLTESHVREFAEMVVHFYEEDPGDYPMTLERALRQAAEMLERPEGGAIPLLMHVDGALAGYAILVPYYSNEFGGWTVWLDELFIRPESRGRGLGGMFLDQLRAWALDRDMVRIVLEVRPDNEGARRLYGRHGFATSPNTMMAIQLVDPTGAKGE